MKIFERKKTNYTKFPDEHLKDLLKDLKFQLIRSYTAFSEGKKGSGKKLYHSKNIKKEIARIKTEQTRRLIVAFQ